MQMSMQGHRFTLHGASAYTPRSIGSHSTEHRLTLHGASGYTPRSINTDMLKGVPSPPNSERKPLIYIKERRLSVLFFYF